MGEAFSSCGVSQGSNVIKGQLQGEQKVLEKRELKSSTLKSGQRICGQKKGRRGKKEREDRRETHRTGLAGS